MTEIKRREKAAPTFPYVDFEFIGKSYIVGSQGNYVEKTKRFRFNLDSTDGTLDHVIKYTRKRYQIVGFGNLDMKGLDGKIPEELSKIESFCRSLLDAREAGRAEAKKDSLVEKAEEMQRQAEARVKRGQ